MHKKTKLEVPKTRLDEEIFEELFADSIKKYSDALTYDDIANITGYNQKRIPNWISSEKLKCAKLNDRVNIVSKQWLLEFMLTEEFPYNY